MKVADFGIAKTPDATNTLTGHILGTIAYLSPERLAGAPACVADDLYAVGVVGYEALAGHRPFPQENMAALAGAILHGRPPRLAGPRPDVDPTLVMLIERAMAHDPRQRFGSAEEMRAELHHRRPAAAAMPGVAPPPYPATKLLEVPVAGAPTNTSFTARISSTTSRRRKLLGILAVLAVLILVPLALALDASSSHAPGAPATTSTPAPVPVNSAAPPPSPPPQQPPVPALHGPGKGHGKGNGGGKGD
jgi:serine/threonine-protein kinase